MTSPQKIKKKTGRPTQVASEKPTADKIFHSAIDLFSKNGYEATSIRMIAKKVGITEGAVYRHYKSKELILDSVLAYADKLIFSKHPIFEYLEENRSNSVFRCLLSPIPKAIEDPFILKITRIVYLEILRNKTFLDYYQKNYVEKADAYMEVFFKDAIENGNIIACNPTTLAKLFNTFRTQWAFQTFVINNEESLDIDAIKQELEDMIMFFEEHFVG